MHLSNIKPHGLLVTFYDTLSLWQDILQNFWFVLFWCGKMWMFLQGQIQIFWTTLGSGGHLSWGQNGLMSLDQVGQESPTTLNLSCFSSLFNNRKGDGPYVINFLSVQRWGNITKSLVCPYFIRNSLLTFSCLFNKSSILFLFAQPSHLEFLYLFSYTFPTRHTKGNYISIAFNY